MSLETSVRCRDLKSDIRTSVVNHSNVFQEILEDFASFVLIFSLPLDIVYMNSIKYLWRIRNWIHEDAEVMVGLTYRLPCITCTETSYCWCIYRKCCFLWTWSKMLDVMLALCIPINLCLWFLKGCCNLLRIWSNLR